MRTTKAQIVGMFNRLLRATGTDHYNYSLKRAGWVLDYVACYGGYVIESYNEKGEMQHAPLGLMRRGAREMYMSLCMACEAVEMMNRQHFKQVFGETIPSFINKQNKEVCDERKQ